MEKPERNIQWLTDEVAELFAAAVKMTPCPVSDCVKLADILARILLPQAQKAPVGGAASGPVDLEAIREEAMRARKQQIEERDRAT